MRFVIKANTPEQCKNQIVEWLERNAAIHRVNARLSSRKTRAKEENIKGDAYSMAADFIRNMVVERQ